MPRQRSKDKAWESVHIRCLPEEKNKIKILANQYASGNISAWMLFASLNCPRKVLSAKEVLRK